MMRDYRIIHVRIFNPRKYGESRIQIINVNLTYGVAKQRGNPVATSVVTTIQCFFFACVTYAVTCDQLIYHERYYKIYIRTRFHTGALISRICHVRVAVKNYARSIIEHKAITYARLLCTLFFLFFFLIKRIFKRKKEFFSNKTVLSIAI